MIIPALWRLPVTDTPTGPIEIVLRRSQWRDVAAAVDELPAGYDIPGLDALMRTLADKGLLDTPDAA